MPDEDPRGDVSASAEEFGGCANPTETTRVGNRRDERGHPDPMTTTPSVVYLVIPIPCGQSPLHAPLNDRPIVVCELGNSL